MNGNEVYKFATRQVPKVIKEALDAADMEVEDVDWLLLHQVSFFCAVLATLLHIECIHQQIMNHFVKILTYMPSIQLQLRQIFVSWRQLQADLEYQWKR